jgi:hypothetical protein
MGGNNRKIRSEVADIWADDINWDYTLEEGGSQETVHLNDATVAPLQTLMHKLDLDRLITKERSSDQNVPKTFEKEHSKEEDYNQTMCIHNRDHSLISRVSFEQELFIYSRNQEHREQAKRSIRSEDFHMFLDLAVGEESHPKTAINENASLITLIQNELKLQCKDYRASQIGDGQPEGSLVVKCALFKAVLVFFGD